MKKTNFTALAPTLAIEPLGLDIRAASQIARTLGFVGLAIGIQHPEFNSIESGRTAQRHFSQILARQGLALVAIRAGMGKSGFFDPATAPRLLDDALAACELAHILNTSLVSVYIGEPNDDQMISSDVVEILHVLADQADRTDVTVTLSCGNAEWLLKLLNGIDAHCMIANLDSARVLAYGGSPLDAVGILAERIAMWTCTDAIRTGTTVQMTPLGAGRASGEQVLRILQDQSFTGPIIVDVRDLPDPIHAAENSYSQLKQWIFR